MSDEDNLRSVSLVRTGARSFEATNVRGGTIRVGEGESADFTPVELLLTAVAGCSSIDVDYLTSRRAEPVSFRVVSAGTTADTAGGSRLESVRVSFEVTFPDGADGDRAREFLPIALAKSHDRLCTVSRTIELPTPVAFEVAPGADQTD